jgi:polyisoprenoid-binding protein YceI
MRQVFLSATAATTVVHMTDTTIVPSTLPLTAGDWTLDTNHSSINFAIRHLGVSKVRGRFGKFDVQLHVGTSLADTVLTATVDLASIDTGNADRDAHVSSDFLIDVARRPTMTFRSTRITGQGEEWAVEGQATIGEITQPMELAVDFGGIEPFPGGPRHAGFEATGEFRRKAFGIDIDMPPGVGGAMLGDVLKFQLDIQLLEPQATPAG